MGFPHSSIGKESACSAGDPGLIPGSGKSPGEGNGNTLPYSFLEIPWAEEPGGLLSMESHRVGQDWSDLAAAAAAYPFSSGSSRPRNQTQVSRIVGRRFTIWTTREACIDYSYDFEHLLCARHCVRCFTAVLVHPSTALSLELGFPVGVPLNTGPLVSCPNKFGNCYLLSPPLGDSQRILLAP